MPEYARSSGSPQFDVSNWNGTVIEVLWLIPPNQPQVPSRRLILPPMNDNPLIAFVENNVPKVKQ